MTGLIGGPIPDAISVREIEADIVQAPASAGWAASLASSFASNPLTGLALRASERVAADNPSILEAADPATQFQAPQQMEQERGPLPTVTMVPKDEANKRFGLPGLTFDSDVSEAVAEQLYKTHRERLVEEDTQRRAGTGLGAKITTGLLAGFLDPANVASAFVPVVPGAWAAARLAAATGALGRAGVRAGVGAVEGVAGQAMIEPFSYALNRAEMNDYTMADVATNLLFGAVLGAGLHTAIGGVFGRVPERAPEDHRAITQAAIADVVAGRPVDVAALIDFADARSAASRLETWHAQQERILAEADRQRQPFEVGRTVERGSAIADAEARLEALRTEADSLRAEHGEAVRRLRVDTVDPVTRARIDDVQAELGKVIPKARRRALNDELQMLMEGTRDEPVAGLEAERSQAQVAGLNAALTRANERSAEAEANLARLRGEDTAAAEREQARRASRERSDRITQERTDSRESTVQRLMEKEVRRFAHQAGVALDAAEVAAMAREIRLARPAELQDTLAATLNSIVARSTNEQFQPARASLEAGNTGAERLRAEADGAAQAVRQRAQTAYQDPEVQQATRRNRETLETAPKAEGSAAEQAAEVQKLLADAQRDYDIEVRAGRLPDAETIAGLEAADKIEKDGKALAEAVSCVANGGA